MDSIQQNEKNTSPVPRREGNKVDNAAYNERYKFVLYANENIICERYFKINHFLSESLNSAELLDTMGGIVELIQRDLVSKSRIYSWYNTPTPVKMTGFKPDGLGIEMMTRQVGEDGKEHIYRVPNPDATYLEYPKGSIPEFAPTLGDAYDVYFKFSFQIAQKSRPGENGEKPVYSDYRPVYELIWDGTCYPKDVRNSVDITNNDQRFRNRDVNAMNFTQTLNYRMVVGKPDLCYEIIRRICAATSNPNDDTEHDYTKSVWYGDKKYYYSAYSREYVEGWRKATMSKTRKYFRENGIEM